MNNPYLISGLRNGPLCILALLDLLPESALDSHPDPDRFSPREGIAHLADWEVILRGRLQHTLTEPGIEIAGIDEGQCSLDKAYATLDIREQAEIFRTEREKTIGVLEQIEPSEWFYEASHLERGIMTVEDQASMLLGHDLYHIVHLLGLVQPA